MRSVLAAAAATAVVALLALVSLPTFGAALAVELLLALVAILALRWLLPGLPAPVAGRRWWHRRRSMTPPPSWLLSHQGMLLSSVKDTASAERRLLKQLRSLAAERLAARHRVDMAGEPAAAREILGEEAWNLLRPDWATGRGPWDPGPSLAQVEATVSAIERL